MKRRKRKKSRPAAPGAEPPLQPVYPEIEPPVSEPAPAARAEGAGADASAPEREMGRRRRGRRRRKPRAAAPVEAAGAERQPAVEEPEIAKLQPQPVELATPQPEARVPAEAPAAPIAPPRRKPTRGVVVLAIGLPGSGKTSWFRRRGITPLSSDVLRMLLFDNITEQRYQDLVFSTLRNLLRARMIAHMPWNYVDATNLSPRERRGWIKMAQEFGYDVQAVFFDVPLEVCQERNRKRGRIVPQEVMQGMAQKLRPPAFEEGFARITVVRVKRAAGASGGAQPSSEQEPEQEADWEDRYDSE